MSSARVQYPRNYWLASSLLDSAVAESFFQLLKRERIRRQIYADREEARRDIFNYIEMFYKPKRRQRYAIDVFPIKFEMQHFNRLQCVY